MKPSIFILFFLSLIFFSFSQNDINPNGYNVFYHQNGNKSSEGILVDGKPEGWWKSYNEDGKIISEGNRKNFLLDSTWTFYDNEGNKTLEINYKEGKKEGLRIQYWKDEYVVENWHKDTLSGNVNTYDSSGWVKKTTPFLNGKAHGMEKSFDKEGNVKAIAHFYQGILTKREYINHTDQLGQKQGNWKFFWENGNIKLEGHYTNDKKDGFFKEYDENGNFLAVFRYHLDELVEDAKETKKLDKKVTYFSNGQVAIEATYFRDKPEGIRREYDSAGNIVQGYIFSDGILKNRGITDHTGKREGVWKEYYETGELRWVGNYKNSVPIGEWKYYFISQEVEMVGSYNNEGNKEGEWKWFYPNGNLLRVEHYVDGELDGEYFEYDENENIITKGVFLEGLEEEEWFYKHGNITEIGKYFEGKRTGYWKTIYENEKTATEANYDQDLLNGKYVSYWENGNVRLKGKYISGVRNGIWYKYQENGELFITIIYQDGIEIKWNNYTIGQ